MVEEVHLLESQQAQELPEAANKNASTSSDLHLGKFRQMLPPHKTANMQAKRSRREMSEQSHQDHINAAVDDLSSNYGEAPISGNNGFHFAFSRLLPSSAGNHISLQMTDLMESASANASESQNQHFG